MKKGIRISIEAKAALILTLATFLCKGINIITTPIFTRILSTYEMGIVTTYNAWYSIISVVATLSLDSGSFNIAMMEYKEDRYGYMSSALTLSSISSLIIVGVYALFHETWNSIMGLDSVLVVLMLISFIFLPAVNFYLLHQRYEYKYISTAIITLMSTGISTIFSAFCTYLAFSKDYNGLANVRLLSANSILILLGIVIYIFIMCKGRRLYSKKYWTFILSVNTPLLIHAAAKHILDISDRMMISNIAGKDAVGIYGVVYSVSALALIVWSAINASLIPYMFENLKKENEEKVAVTVERMLLVYAGACVFISLIAPEILMILATEEYFEGIYMMPPIAAGIFFTALYNIYSNLLLYYKKTKTIMIATIIAAVINLVLNYVFINKYGYMAACYTTIISYIILAFMQYMALNRVACSRTILNDKRIWLIAVGTGLVCMVSNILYSHGVIRYGIIALLVGIGLIKHKVIIKMLKTK